MSELTRRKLITTGLAVTAGASGLVVAAKLAKRYGLIPPDSGGVYGPGETLTYAAQRLLTRHSLAREFPRNYISAKPFANEVEPFTDEFKRLQQGAFADWRLAVDGLVTRPTSFSLAEIKSLPRSSHITMVQNGAELPAPHGGPIRMRLPRQLGYKNVKYLTRLTLTDNIKQFGKGLGSVAAEFSYAWYAGI